MMTGVVTYFGNFGAMFPVGLVGMVAIPVKSLATTTTLVLAVA